MKTEQKSFTSDQSDHRASESPIGDNADDHRSSESPIGDNPIRASRVESGISDLESDCSEQERKVDQRSVYTAKIADYKAADRKKPSNLPSRLNKPSENEHYEVHKDTKPCAQCGSIKHDDRGCWKRLICQKRGRKGHPSEKCYFVCGCCGDVHDAGKCPMEEFYNRVREWYVPSKLAGYLPPEVEEMLN